MSPLSVGLIGFICTFGGAMAGMRLRSTLPEEHLEDRSKSTINVDRPGRDDDGARARPGHRFGEELV